MKFLIKLAVLLLIAHALVRFVPPYWNHTQFERELKDSSIAWRDYSDAEVRELVLAMAQQREVPVDRQQVAVRRERDHLFIDLAYSRALALVPGSRYTWDYESKIDTWMLTPQSPRR